MTEQENNIRPLKEAVDWGIREYDDPADPENRLINPNPEIRAFLEGAGAILRFIRGEKPDHPLLGYLMGFHRRATGIVEPLSDAEQDRIATEDFKQRLEERRQKREGLD